MLAGKTSFVFEIDMEAIEMQGLRNGSSTLAHHSSISKPSFHHRIGVPVLPVSQVIRRQEIPDLEDNSNISLRQFGPLRLGGSLETIPETCEEATTSGINDVDAGRTVKFTWARELIGNMVAKSRTTRLDICVDDEKDKNMCCTWKRNIVFLILLGIIFISKAMKDSTLFITVAITEPDMLYKIEPPINKDNSTYYAFFNCRQNCRGYYLGVFYLAYSLTFVMCHCFTKHIGYRWLLFLGAISMSFVTCITPLAGYESRIWPMIYIRAFQGMSFYLVNFGVHMIFSFWTPRDELKSKFAWMLAFSHFGTAFSMLTSSFMLYFGLNWEYLMLALGLCGFALSLLQIIFIKEYPHTDPNITITERKFINDNLLVDFTPVEIPFKRVVSSPGVLATFISILIYLYFYETYLMQMPYYLATYFEFDILTNGGLSAMSFVAIGLSTWSTCFLLRKTELFVIKVEVTKMFNCLGLLVTGIAIHLASSNILSNLCRASILSLGFVFFGVGTSGILMNYMDMVPKYSRELFHLTEVLGYFLLTSSPVLCDFIVSVEIHANNWNIVWIIQSFLIFCLCVTYLGWGSTKLRLWGTFEFVKQRESTHQENPRRL